MHFPACKLKSGFWVEGNEAWSEIIQTLLELHTKDLEPDNIPLNCSREGERWRERSGIEFVIWPCIIFYDVLIYIHRNKERFFLGSHDLESTFYTTPNLLFHT